MEIVDSPELRTEIIKRIAKKFNIGGSDEERRENIHASDLIYCLTLSYWKKMTSKLQLHTEKKVLQFAAGLGLEEVLLEDDDSNNRPAPLEVDGIILSADYEYEGRVGELKTTRAYFNKEGEPSKGYSKGWLKQMAAYAYAHKTQEYYLAVFQIIQAEIFAKKVTFEEQELLDFWNGFMLPRKKALEDALAEGKPPQPFAYNAMWECKNCPMSMTCETNIEKGEEYYAPKTIGENYPDMFKEPV